MIITETWSFEVGQISPIISLEKQKMNYESYVFKENKERWKCQQQDGKMHKSFTKISQSM